MHSIRYYLHKLRFEKYSAEEDLNALDVYCIVEDYPRGTILRVGATDQRFESRQKEHKKAPLIKALLEKTRRFSLLYLDETITASLEGRCGSFQNLK